MPRTSKARRAAARAAACARLNEAIAGVNVRNGVQLAPFLSAAGNPVLMTVVGEHRLLWSMYEVQEAAGWSLYAAGASAASPRGRCHLDRKGLLVERLEDCGVRHLALEVTRYTPPTGLFMPGVHVAPWRSDQHPDGGCVLVIAPGHRLASMFDFADPESLDSTLREARTLYDTLVAATGELCDGRECRPARDDDDEDDPSEAWKQ